jgi:hypothetical protein
MPLPQALQVPSSQFGPFGCSVGADESLDDSRSLALPMSDEPSASACSAADFGSAPVAPPPPHAVSSKSTAKRQGKARIVPSVYVPGP